MNPRASRTVPYISKVTGVPMVRPGHQGHAWARSSRTWATAPGSIQPAPYVAVKVPVFSFEKLTDVDTHLGPEMKSTGEVLGIGKQPGGSPLQGADRRRATR